jgi:hypothetical protein
MVDTPSPLDESSFKLSRSDMSFLDPFDTLKDLNTVEGLTGKSGTDVIPAEAGIQNDC